MEFSSWVSEQRVAIAHLQVDSGYYEVRYSARGREYLASLASGGVVSQSPVIVDRLGGTVQITVRLGAAEYTFRPAWAGRRGLSVERLSPLSVSRETADDTRGRALAALLCAASRIYEQHRDIAMESGKTDEEQEAVLRQLARSAMPIGEPLDGALALALVSDLRGRTDGADLAMAQVDCSCVACGRGYEKGDAGPIVVFGSTVVCRSCLAPARAA